MRNFTVFMVFLSVFLFVSCENSVTKPKYINDKSDDNELTDDLSDEQDTLIDEETFSDESGEDNMVVSDEELIYPDEDDTNGDSCYKNSDCGEDFFCNKFDGLCNDEGKCEAIPGFCNSDYAPVCGCDGETYSNFCFANTDSSTVFYNMVCMKDLKTASMTFSYEKDGLGKETMKGGLTFDFDGNIYELLMLSTPTSQNDGNFANITAVFNGINGVSVVFKVAFQRDPFKLPQTFDLETTGANTAEVKTDFGTTIGFLTGKLTVTKYQVGLGGFVLLEMNAPELSFAK
ncbi:MAG TPA: Kazal-type serine protease inhibitor family protein [bacterium]|nr:Kazal-type serine protease inhibitor family protein [bacterium]